MSKKIITVNVTANDIKNGTPQDSYHCPIHRSLARHKDFKTGIFTVRRSIVCGTFLAKGEALLPTSAGNFIYQFDHGRPVEPFKFRLEYEL